ncbi:hypothetical protein P4S72_05690 [Vibrio sp. PP-XX7]
MYWAPLPRQWLLLPQSVHFVAGGAIGGVAGATAVRAIGDIFYEKAIEIKAWGEEKIEELF